MAKFVHLLFKPKLRKRDLHTWDLRMFVRIRSCGYTGLNICIFESIDNVQFIDKFKYQLQSRQIYVLIAVLEFIPELLYYPRQRMAEKRLTSNGERVGVTFISSNCLLCSSEAFDTGKC